MTKAAPNEHLKRAAEILGSAAELARVMKVAPQYLSDMLKGSRPIPAWRCPAVERALEGKVTSEQLAPAANWVRLIDPTWPHRDGRPLQQHPEFLRNADAEAKAA